MTDEQFDRLERAIVEHGNQLGSNLVFFKKFAKAEREAQEAFLAERDAANAKLQKQSVNAARWAAAAATAAALAAIAPVLQRFV